MLNSQKWYTKPQVLKVLPVRSPMAPLEKLKGSSSYLFTFLFLF